MKMKLKSIDPLYALAVLLANAVPHICSKISETGFVDGINVSVDKEPEFSAPISNTTVALGREAVLTCSVTDLGTYKVGWMKAEDQTILTLHNRVVTHNGRVSVTHDNFRTWQLHIRQVKEADKGCYMCQINTNVMKKQLGCIDVHVPPDISDQMTMSDVTVKEGDNASLTCKAVGHPKPRIVWKREDGESILLKKSFGEINDVETYSGETLHLVKLDRRQMGSYLCIASNDVPPAVSKRITLHVNFQPVITVQNELLSAPLGTNLTLNCAIEAFPYPINYWIRTSENRILQGAKYHVEEARTDYKVQLKLTIYFLNQNDVGSYTCVATNSMGRADGTIRIYEIQIPTSTTMKTTTTTTTITAPPSPTPTTSKKTTIVRSPITRYSVLTTQSSPSNIYRDQHQKNHSVDETVKNAISLTHGSHSRSRMPEFKFINNNSAVLSFNFFHFSLSLLSFLLLR